MGDGDRTDATLVGFAYEQMDDDDWTDVTQIGSAYEQQMSVRSGEFRHREILSGDPTRPDLPFAAGEWRHGPAPSRESQSADP